MSPLWTRILSRNDEEKFCCQGCEVVYFAFQKNGLKDFYQYKDTKSDPVNLNELKDQFAYLDHSETKETFLKLMVFIMLVSTLR
jgi:hypothetical protein